MTNKPVGALIDMRKKNENINVGAGFHARPKKRNNGITLIALVITIVILLILASVAISIVLDPNGIIGKARTGTKGYDIASIKEQIQMELLGKLNDNGEILDSDIITILTKYAGTNGEVLYEEDGTTPKGVNPDKYPEEEILLSDLWNGNTVAGGNKKNGTMTLTTEVLDADSEERARTVIFASFEVDESPGDYGAFCLWWAGEIMDEQLADWNGDAVEAFGYVPGDVDGMIQHFETEPYWELYNGEETIARSAQEGERILRTCD